MVFDQSLRKVIWFEGMNLDPRHFQQTDKFHQAALHFRLKTVNANDWGLVELKINQEALANGQFSLVRCKGIMPDGLLINLPDSDRLPPARALADQFTATLEKLDVFLAIPSEKPLGGNCNLDEKAIAADTRFSWDLGVQVPDENEGGKVLPIGTAQCNFRLKLGNEPLDDYTAIKIAEVKRKAGSGFTLSETFIPTCLRLAASENLMALLRDVLTELTNRSSGQKGQFSFQKAEFNAAEMASFWLAQCLNIHIPILSHYYQLGISHPEQLFLSLSSLAGQLTSFPTKTAISTSDIPFYKHENLQCLVTLKKQILQLLNDIQPTTPYIPVPLEQPDPSQWRSKIIDPMLLKAARIYICVKSRIAEEKLKADIPKLAKIGTPANISQLITYNLPGLSVSFIAHPPVGLPTGSGEQYFRFEKSGENWDAILRESSLALFMPIDLEITTLQVLILKD